MLIYKLVLCGDLTHWIQCKYISMRSFFRLLNRKIKKYDKAATNPFEAIPLSITLVWVEEDKKQNEQNNIS